MQRLLDLKQAPHGLYYCTKPRVDLPPKLEIEGRLFHRHLNFIYIPCLTEELSKDQIVTVAELRAMFFEKLPEQEVNLAVREVFRALVVKVKPRSIIEVGPSYRPLLFPEDAPAIYHVADINRAAVLHLKQLGLDASYFDCRDGLPLNKDQFEMAISLFVLHYSVGIKYLREIARVLKDDGVFFANVYMRSRISRQDLFRSFASCGLMVDEFPDRNRLCRRHWYVCLYFNSSSPLRLAVHQHMQAIS